MYAKPYLTEYNNTEPYYIPLNKRPKIQDASLIDSGNELQIIYNRVIIGHDGFTINASGGPVTLTYVTGDLSNTQVFDLSRPIDPIEIVYLVYSPGNVTDEAGSPLQAFSNLLIQDGSFVYAYRFNDERNSMYLGVF